jgi:hypothetical protein
MIDVIGVTKGKGYKGMCELPICCGNEGVIVSGISCFRRPLGSVCSILFGILMLFEN